MEYYSGLIECDSRNIVVHLKLRDIFYFLS